MNHRKSGRILSRGRNQRRALLKTLLGSLVLHERIETTLAKAKEMKNFIDQIVNKAKRAKSDEAMRLSLTRELHRRIPSVSAEKLLKGAFIDRFDERTCGYTRVVKLEARKGDGAEMAIIEFV
jgi:large subunit ribosomal protein L17